MNQTYLENNAKDPDVSTTTSGLQFKMLKEGKGKSPRLTDKVIVHYEGRLIDETVFDSSYQRGKPAQFKVNGVIKGWGEALTMMSKGSQWELTIPPNLAYGTKGIQGIIPPNSVLIFKVELIKIPRSFFGF